MACATNLGKNAKIAIGANKVARMTAFTLTVNNDSADISEFGTGWMEHCSTIQNWTASMDGFLYLDDTYQFSLHSIALSGGSIANLRFYENATDYWTSNTASVSAANATIESYNWSADVSGVVSFSMSVKGSGPVYRVAP
jgi:predicted secreted protein